MSFSKILLGVLLSVSIALFAGCTTKNSTGVNEPAKKGDYPLAPSELMQAELKKPDGSTFKLADLKGKILIVNVWATWCGPCRQEMPHLESLSNEFKEKGLEVIGLNVDSDDSPEMIKEFGTDVGVNFDLVQGDSKLFKQFYAISKKDAIPQTFLIDREGKLLGVFVGAGSSLKKLIDNTKRVIAES